MIVASSADDREKARSRRPGRALHSVHSGHLPSRARPTLEDPRYRDQRSGFSTNLPPLAQAARGHDVARRPQWVADVWLRGRPHHFGNIVAAAPEGQAGSFAAWIHRNFDPTLTFADVAWLRARWTGAIVVKGVLDPEDAVMAVEAGADGVIVSNHGGRQLDGALPSAKALPKIVDAVGSRTRVLMDGAFGPDSTC